MFRRFASSIFVRRERWGLSRRGLLLLAVLTVAFVYGLMKGASPFLTVNGGKGDVMVVEGWISTRRVEQAAIAFHQGHYQHVVVVRNVSQDGDKWESGAYTADWVASDLVAKGVPTNKIQLIFCPVVRRDRTYACATAVRQWIEQNASSVKSIDVATLAVHTRRSRLLYKKAFGNNVAVGAIALSDFDYDPEHWWRSSEGVREVLGESVAYLYARFLFWPAAKTKT
ncbi:MAG TPA: ElyC/SanA/YdcF family protein [Verrucomicrobiae bacterium]|nr:ElyC/SanA/YdcF family protein [Verrucomicrobiae bacterium]